MAQPVATFDGAITSVDLTAARTWTLPDTTGTLTLGSGFTTNGVAYASNGTTCRHSTAVGSTGQCLTGNTGAAPSWVNCTTNATLQSAYNNDADGPGDPNATIALSTDDDSIIFSNPSSSGTDSAFLVQIDQLSSTSKTGLIINSVASGMATAIDISDADIVDGISLGNNNLVGGTAVINFTNFDVASTGNITVAAAQGIDTNAAGALNLGDTTATSVAIGTAAATLLDIGAGGALDRTINVGTGTGVDTIHIGDGATGADVITIGSTNAGNVSVSSGATLALLGATTNINVNANNATNIATGSNNTLTTIGGGAGTFSLQTTNIDISNTGAISSVKGYSQVLVF